jgi:molecular chaperone GrpE (heat shock protein)
MIIWKTLLPVIDNIEAGLQSGIAQVKRLHPTAPEAAQVLYGWLTGQRLLRYADVVVNKPR